VRIKKKKLAEKAFLKSFKLAPDSALTAMLLAELYTFTFKTKLNEGKKWYEKALELGAKRSERLDAFYAGGRKKRDERKAK
jgi:hypothetical protein